MVDSESIDLIKDNNVFLNLRKENMKNTLDTAKEVLQIVFVNACMESNF